MSLEKDIKNKKFGNEHEKSIVNVLYTASWLENLELQRFKPHDLSNQQYNVLRILRGSAPNAMMLSDISSRMVDRNSNATRLVEKLKQKGLVNRVTCPSNRRQVDITITDKGLKLLKKIDDESVDHLDTFSGLTKKEAAQLNALLDKMRGSE
jgi:DNA-binding MarR family transcriptional regulator